MNRSGIVLASTANLLLATVPNAYAACVFTSEVAARARFVRCEDAHFYLAASGTYEYYEQWLAEELARTDPQRHAALRERLGIEPNATSLLPDDYAARVIVVMVDWRLSIAPWNPAASTAVEAMSAPQALHETARYWWSGPVEQCENLSSGAMLDLWVRPPCCDTIPASPVCRVSMSYAELAPEEVSIELSSLLLDL